MGELKAQLLLSLCVWTWATPRPQFGQSSADYTLCLYLQFGRGRSKEGKLSCQSSACQVGSRGNQSSQISSLEEPSVKGKLSNNLHLSDAGDQVMVQFLLAIFFLRAETRS